MKKSLRNDQFTKEVQRKCIAYSHLLYYRNAGRISKRRVYKEVLSALDSFGCCSRTLQKELNKDVMKLCEAGRIAHKYNQGLEYWYKELNLLGDTNYTWTRCTPQ